MQPQNLSCPGLTQTRPLGTEKKYGAEVLCSHRQFTSALVLKCDDDHESYELKPPAITYADADLIAPDMGSVDGNGYISADRFPGAFQVLRTTPAGLQRGGDHGRHKYL
jgi:hypothetical protein